MGGLWVCGCGCGRGVWVCGCVALGVSGNEQVKLSVPGNPDQEVDSEIARNIQHNT